MSRVDYDRLAAGYDKRYAANALDGIARALRSLARGRVLEVGCGTGRWLSELPGALGIDTSLAMLARSRSPVAAADAVALPFRPATFDFVYCVNVLHHVNDRNACFREARRVLRDGGIAAVIAIDPARIDSWFVYDYFDGARAIDLARYATLERIASMLESAGFHDVVTMEVERARFSWTAGEVLSSPLAARESNSLLALLPDEVFAQGLERIRVSAAGTKFETDMPFFAVYGRL